MTFIHLRSYPQLCATERKRRTIYDLEGQHILEGPDAPQGGNRREVMVLYHPDGHVKAIPNHQL